MTVGNQNYESKIVLNVSITHIYSCNHIFEQTLGMTFLKAHILVSKKGP